MSYAQCSSVSESSILKSAAQQSCPDHTFRALPSCRGNLASAIKCAALVALLVLAANLAFAKVTGSISGTARDSQGAVINGATVQVKNVETGVAQTIQTDSVGFYNFPALSVGHYEITFQKSGFSDYKKTALVINVDTALQVDAEMQVGAAQQVVSVEAAAAQVETRSAEMGQVISGREMTDLPLNGRAYTDLLALQPGVVPIDAAMYGSLSPANSLSNGLLSMSGSRDVNSGFMVNGANTVEGFGGGTFLVPISTRLRSSG